MAIKECDAILGLRDETGNCLPTQKCVMRHGHPGSHCSGSLMWGDSDRPGDLVEFDDEEQPPPQPNTSRPIWELVIEDMHQRDQVGRQRYGTPLQAHNGRDALQDAYEEALDLCAYLRQAIEERG